MNCSLLLEYHLWKLLYRREKMENTLVIFTNLKKNFFITSKKVNQGKEMLKWRGWLKNKKRRKIRLKKMRSIRNIRNCRKSMINFWISKSSSSNRYRFFKWRNDLKVRRDFLKERTLKRRERSRNSIIFTKIEIF